MSNEYSDDFNRLSSAMDAAQKDVFVYAMVLAEKIRHGDPVHLLTHEGLVRAVDRYKAARDAMLAHTEALLATLTP